MVPLLLPIPDQVNKTVTRQTNSKTNTWLMIFMLFYQKNENHIKLSQNGPEMVPLPIPG